MKKILKKKKTAEEIKKDSYPDYITCIVDEDSSYTRVEREEVERGDVLLVDEGTQMTQFLVVYVGDKIHTIDISSKGKFAESYVSISFSEWKERKVGGLPAALYSPD